MKPIHFLIFFVALLIGVFIDEWMIPTGNPSKKYPIEVTTNYKVSVYDGFTSTMCADSVRRDTIWKDGIYITNKNIVEIKFK